MFLRFATLLVLSCALSFGFADEFKEDEGVLVLTKDNFDKALEKHQYVLAEFCKCKLFAEHYLSVCHSNPFMSYLCSNII